MLYAKIENDEVVEFPINDRTLRVERLPNTSLPDVLTDEILQGTGYVCVSPFSSYLIPNDTPTQRPKLAYPVKNENGEWERTWELVDVPEDQLEPRRLMKLKEIRAKRDKLMARVDKLIMRYHRETRLGQEPTFSIERLDTYMKALADITNEPDLWNITWPSL